MIRRLKDIASDLRDVELEIEQAQHYFDQADAEQKPRLQRELAQAKGRLSWLLNEASFIYNCVWNRLIESN